MDTVTSRLSDADPAHSLLFGYEDFPGRLDGPRLHSQGRRSFHCMSSSAIVTSCLPADSPPGRGYMICVCVFTLVGFVLLKQLYFLNSF